MKRICGILLLFAVVIMCSGCNTIELENRGFPLAIGIDKTEEGIVLTFDFADLAEVSDGKSLSGEPLGFSVEAGSYYEAQKAYENNRKEILDYNHLKAIVIGQEFLADGQAMRDLFSWLEGEAVLARNTNLFIAKEGAASILAMKDESLGSIGQYLEQMAKSQEDFKENKAMTIGKLMNEWHNQSELLLLPVLTDNGGVPSITEYATVSFFEYKGNISVEDSMKAFLSQGLLKKMTYRLFDGEVLEIKDISTRATIENDGTEGVVSIFIKGNAKVKKGNSTGTVLQGQIKKKLDSQMQESLTEAGERLLLNSNIDMSNSFRMLGGYNRYLYHLYVNRWPEYLEHISLQFSVDIDIVNE